MFDKLIQKVYTHGHIYLLRFRNWYHFYQYNNRLGRQGFQSEEERLASLLNIIDPKVFGLDRFIELMYTEENLLVSDQDLFNLTKVIWSLIQTVSSGDIVEFKQERSQGNDISFRNYFMLSDNYIANPVKTIKDFKSTALVYVQVLNELKESNDPRDKRNYRLLSTLIKEIEYLSRRIMYFQFR